METTPSLRLGNGVLIPAIGLGTYRIAPDRAAETVGTALECGYRLIDTAANYHNQRGVGEAIHRSDVPRDEIFVTTKLWIADYGYENTFRAFEHGLTELRLDSVDLYLLHQPLSSSFDLTIQSYRAMEQLLSDGRVRAIGVCNFSAERLHALGRASTVTPAVNQVEIHPYFTQESLRREHAKLGILTQAWSPIGGINVYWHEAYKTAGSPLVDRTVVGIATEVGRTPAQVVLRWQFQLGHCSIPKSYQAARMAENLDIFDFELTAEQMRRIDALDTGVRGGPDPDTIRR